MLHPKWRIISLLVMSIALVFLVIAVGSTDWRQDYEPWLDITSTFGLWRICRDIRFGATLDHQCLLSLANDAPKWYQVFRAFLCLALLFEFVAFAYGVYLIATIPIPTPETYKRNIPDKPVSLALPGLLMFVGAIFCLIGVATYAIATQLKQALYFPPNLTPVWADSWAQVWAKAQSQPQNRVTYNQMTTKYGYSFAFGWLAVIGSFASAIVNLIARG